MVWAIAVLGLPVLLHALKIPTTPSDSVGLLEESVNPGKALEFLEQRVIKKKWNWQEASEESKTEWAIVLKRYRLADLTLFEMDRHLGEAIGVTGVPTAEDKKEALELARAKFAKLSHHLELAIGDQNTSDTTAVDMQKVSRTNLLTTHQKRVLADEHKREQYGYFAIEASGQDVLEKASELFQALDVKKPQPKKVESSWGSIVAAPVATPAPKVTYMSLLNVTVEAAPNATQSSGNARSVSKPTVADIFKRFEGVAKVYHKDLGSFESMQSKAITNFLSISS